MSDISGSGTLQFWQGIAAVVGASIGGFVLAIGRRAGAAASKATDSATTGDALQRDILAAVKENTDELRGLRTDWQAKREADEDRRRHIRERSIDEQMDDIRRELRVRRAGQDDIKHLLGDVRDRLPQPDAFDRRARLAAPEADPAAEEAS